MPRNRLAGMHVPPGGTSVLAQFWVFVVELLGGGWHSARWFLCLLMFYVFS